MKKLFSILGALFVLAGMSFAQQGLHRGTAPADYLNYTSTWEVCTPSQTVSQCVASPVAITSDSAGNNSITQPVSLQSNGFITFYAPPGIYQILMNCSTTTFPSCPGSYLYPTAVVPDVLGNINLNDAFVWVPAQGNCVSSVSGNSTGTNGNTTAGTSGTPVVQAQTSGSGTNTHTYICSIPVDSRSTTGKAASVADVTFMYGVQSNALGTQAAVLASGTFNGTTVFSKIVYPAAAGSESASTVAPARADSGTSVYTPAAASANTATTTAGAFYSQKFAPAAVISIADLNQLFVSVTLQCAATTATITNTPGFLVHYQMSGL